MQKRYRRYFLKAKETKHLLARASEKLNIELEKIFHAKTNVELIETDFGQIFLINGKPQLVKIGETIFPTLIFEEAFTVASKVIVNMGAVPHVCNGADVMAPGIVRFEGEFNKGSLVFVVDEKHGKPIAVGDIVCDVDDIKKVKQGVVVKNIHFVGDKIWSFIKEI